ncbi:dNA replication and repair protein RecF [Clostridium sp. CAG:465]|nr:dNA replication and repair protein RecF [Clostridium sp. CAG:465]
MQLNKLILNNFRNYKYQEIDLINGINFFEGNNAQGKTNIIESIYMCAFGKSYRTTKDIEVLKFNEEFCRITLTYKKNDIESNIEVYIDKNNKKQLKKDGVKITRLSNHVGEIPLVIFSPDSLNIVKGAPSKRRTFIDMICSQLSKSYLINLQEYNKCLKIKNTLLKNENIDKDYIYVLHEKMSDYIYNIVKYREIVINEIFEKAKNIHKDITNGKENIKITYVTDFFNMEKNKIKEVLDSHLYIDILRKSSVKGIQKDDILIEINDMEVQKYGSQGQNRTVMLVLKLANFEVLREKKEENPILLLDDIMSELDENRINFLLKYIENYQSIITTTDSSFVENVDNIKISKVSNGRLEI